MPNFIDFNLASYPFPVKSAPLTDNEKNIVNGLLSYCWKKEMRL
ncbi:hypothetical protein ARSQ2_01061 [Arsenophonus endosymbiont of Bemisia tabaci Q2]|nr:hypothetical protein ARSQ2_01061 [Arsenophonus endosymbiont of Bemisia tabaci Q2]